MTIYVSLKIHGPGEERKGAMKVLIVDDSRLMQSLLKDLLESRGYQVTQAHDAESALASYQKEFFPLILLDWEMPKMSGLELARKIRKIQYQYPCVILMVTGRKQKNDLAQILDAGADDYIGKPIDESLIHVRLTIAERKVNSNKKNHDNQLALEKTQVQLIQSEKMATLGQLAAGVAHEINNPIGFIKSNLCSLSEYIEIFLSQFKKYKNLLSFLHDPKQIKTLIAQIQDEEEKENLPFILNDISQLLEESIEGSERVSQIVSNLKSFSRIDESETKEFDLNEGIQSTLRLLHNEIKYKCKVETKLNPLPKILCASGQLNQVFMNLIVNAIQACDEKGEIYIQSSHLRDHVEIKVSDNGVGIPKHALPNIFDPFFTTKPVGEGTGLGLSLSYGIIQEHNGEIKVKSQEGKGTEFTVRIPIVRGVYGDVSTLCG